MRKINKLQLTPGGAPEKHILKSKTDFQYASITPDGQSILFELKNPAVITHDEHDKIVLDQGVYVKTNQVEFNPFTKRIDYVFD